MEYPCDTCSYEGRCLKHRTCWPYLDWKRRQEVNALMPGYDYEYVYRYIYTVACACVGASCPWWIYGGCNKEYKIARATERIRLTLLLKDILTRRLS